MAINATILGPAGPTLTDWERGFFRDADPLGFILFARNIDTPDQLRALTDDLRGLLGRAVPILIDQEGGRVQRMRAPHWRAYLPALDQMARARDPMRAQWLRNRLIAAELHDVGIDVNCAPLADLVEDVTHPVLRNRLYGRDVDTVVQAARICAAALLAGGVLPVLKHIPGYGRAAVDSHKALPTVTAPRADLNARDFAPFRALNDIAMGMTAHIVCTDVDPDNPVTTSPAMMQVIRRDIGFGGLIMTDDISMQALSGDLTDRAAAAVAAGCDIVLHCNGDAAEMQAVVAAAGAMTPAAMTRANHALAQRKHPAPIDIPALEAEFKALLA
ncbi:glycoside hydrolase family 3 N-terminal domain-containing protein [Yoonia sp.]|uniref:glycoside hydrolase family 3 N-terminal domain-containing protein n=1 Tax=Yoonia sp. TaxID=2212373 RepID=UPI0019EA0EF2|nr:glycoside hydrolase family 3 N-terminal domain-containing protein [Yoonia sp.]MBE0412842.1 glycoside hydrolase family 3 protein [Yoonia sp.]